MAVMDATLPRTRFARVDKSKGILGWLTTVDHKRIAIMYLFLTFFLKPRKSYDGQILLTWLFLYPALRFSDEYVRHKVLDLIGDLALAGRRIEGLVVAERAGHAMHTALVARLMKDRSAWELAHVPAAAAEAEDESLTVAAMRRPALIGA